MLVVYWSRTSGIYACVCKAPDKRRLGRNTVDFVCTNLGYCIDLFFCPCAVIFGLGRQTNQLVGGSQSSMVEVGPPRPVNSFFLARVQHWLALLLPKIEMPYGQAILRPAVIQPGPLVCSWIPKHLSSGLYNTKILIQQYQYEDSLALISYTQALLSRAINSSVQWKCGIEVACTWAWQLYTTLSQDVYKSNPSTPCFCFSVHNVYSTSSLW